MKSNTNTTRQNRTSNQAAFYLRYLMWMLVTTVVWCQVIVPGIAQESSVLLEEYKVKYAFLWGQTKYIRWPDLEAKTPFIIGFLKEAPHRDIIDAIAKKREVHGCPIKTLVFASTNNITNCHVLYIPNSSSIEEVKTAISIVREYPTLTVGESPDFCSSGGILSYSINDQGTLDFELNPSAASRQKLSIDARLSKLAKVLTQEDVMLRTQSSVEK